jgi:hypothetical protein
MDRIEPTFFKRSSSDVLWTWRPNLKIFLFGLGRVQHGTLLAEKVRVVFFSESFFHHYCFISKPLQFIKRREVLVANKI